MRFPAVSDLARGVVFRWFAQPLLRRNRAKVYAAVRDDLRYLDRNPDAPDRAERIQAMVASSEPLVRLIGQRIGRPGRDHAPLLEVLTRRYYGNRGLSGVTAREAAGCRFVTAEHTGPRGVTRVVTTAVDIAALPDAIGAVGTFAADVAERGAGRRPLRHVGGPAGRRRDGGAARTSSSPSTRCPRASAGSPPPSPAPAAR